jgi:hypothetical protein
MEIPSNKNVDYGKELIESHDLTKFNGHIDQTVDENIKNFEVNIKKNYIKNYQDFLNIFEDVYKTKIEFYKIVKSLSIVKNYINSEGFSQIINNHINIFLQLKYLNL